MAFSNITEKDNVNILHVFGTRAALEHWLLSDVLIAGDSYKRGFANGKGHVEVDGMRFTCIVIRELEDVEMVRGSPYSLVMLHDSFGRNLYRMNEHHRIVHHLQANCLRT